MSISGTGAQNDPYVVTTWAELVEKAYETEKYTQVANDIDVLAEYPSGNVPTLSIRGYVDGNDCTLKGVYNTESKHIIAFSPSYAGLLENANFANINTNYSLIDNRTGSSSHVNLKNCKFAGKMQGGYILNRPESYSSGGVEGCSFNIKGGDLHLCNDYYNQTYRNCNIKLDTNATYLCYQDAYNYACTWLNCYMEINAPNLTEFGDDYRSLMKFDNTVLDLTTPNAVPIRVSDNAGISIFNSDHAPNMTTTGNVKAVSTENWLNVSYLQSIGFDIMEVET